MVHGISRSDVRVLLKGHIGFHNTANYRGDSSVEHVSVGDCSCQLVASFTGLRRECDDINDVT